MREFREFFTRHIQVNSGSKPDQQANYPLQYTIVKNGQTFTVFNRFLQDDVPSEDVFKKLFQSITFKLNPEDTATSSLQGLAKRASDLEVIDRQPTAEYLDLMTRFVQPGQIPQVIGNNVVSSSIIDNGTTRQTYEIVSNNILQHRITTSSITGDTANSFVAFSNVNHTYTLLAGKLRNGEYLEIEADFYKTVDSYFDINGFSVNRLKHIKLGGNTTISLAESISIDNYDRLRLKVKLIRLSATQLFVTYGFSKSSPLAYLIGNISPITGNLPVMDYFDNPASNVGTGLVTVPDMDTNDLDLQFFAKIDTAGTITLRRTLYTIFRLG